METRPAIYTTEFWIQLILQVILSLNTLNIWNYIPKHWEWVSVLAQALLGSFYVLGRGIAKSKGTFDPTNSGNYTLFPRRSSFTNRR